MVSFELLFPQGLHQARDGFPGHIDHCEEIRKPTGMSIGGVAVSSTLAAFTLTSLLFVRAYQCLLQGIQGGLLFRITPFFRLVCPLNAMGRNP